MRFSPLYKADIPFTFIVVVLFSLIANALFLPLTYSPSLTTEYEDPCLDHNCNIKTLWNEATSIRYMALLNLHRFLENQVNQT